MSQISTQELEGGAPSANRRIPGGSDTPRVQEIGAPTYRESFLPINVVPDTSGARMAAELQHDLGLAGHDVAALGEYAKQDRDQQQRMSDRAEAKKEKTDRLQDTADHIAASSALAVDHPTVLGHIATGQITLPDNVTPEEYAPQIVAQMRGEDHTPGFIAKYDPALTGEVIGALYKQQEQHVQKAAVELSKAHGPALGIAAKTEGDFTEAISQLDSLTGDRVSHETNAMHVLGGAANDVALTGGATPEDRQAAIDRFDMIEKVAGPDMAIPMQIMRNRLMGTLQKQQGIADRNFNNEVAGTATEGIEGDTGVPVPPDIQESMAIESAQRWGAEPSVRMQALERIRARADGAQKRFEKQQTDSTEQWLRSKFAETDAATLENGDTPGGGLGAIAHKVKVQMPDGTHREFTRDERAAAATQFKFEGIDQQYPVDGPTASTATTLANFNARFDFMGKSGTTDPTLESTVGHADRLVTPGMADKDVPPRFNEAYNQYEMGYAKNPSVMQAHFKPGDKTLGLFEAIHHLRQWGPPNMTIAQAASDAMRVADGKAGEIVSKNIPDDEVIKALPQLGIAKNNGEAKDIVKNYARAYEIIGGGNPMDAAKERFNQDWTMQRGFLVNVKAHPIVKRDNFDMDGVSGAVVGHFLDSHPAEGGQKMAGNMVLAPERDGKWSIRYNSTFGTRVIDSPLLDDHDLASVSALIQNKKDREEYPGRYKQAQEDFESQRYGGTMGKIGRFIDTIGSGIGGVPASPKSDWENKHAGQIAPPSAPAEITDINPALKGVAEWIKNPRDVKASAGREATTLGADSSF